MVWSPWDCHKITALHPCNFMGTVRAPCGNRAIAVWGPYDYSKEPIITIRFFVPKIHQKSCPHDRRAASVRCLCGDCAMLPTWFRACDFFFFFCKSVELNKIIEATAPVNPYNNHMAASFLRMEAARTGRYGHLTGAIRSSYICVGLR